MLATPFCICFCALSVAASCLLCAASSTFSVQCTAHASKVVACHMWEHESKIV